MTTRSGAEVLLEVLRSEGVRYIFGNPGSTELPFIDALSDAPDLHYVLALHEASAVAMADGYAQATRRPAFLNFHTMSGLGNAIGALTNARANGTPMVVTAGQQHQDLLVGDPLLSDALVGIARPVSKWSHEVRSLGELGTMVRRAFHDAMTPPMGPVFLSIPISVLLAQGDPHVPGRSHIDRTVVSSEVGELARRLAAVPVGRLAIVLAQEVAHAGAIDAVRELAELLGAPVLGAPSVPVGVFPPAHPLWAGWLLPNAASMRAVLEPFASVLFLGGQPFLMSSHVGGSPVPDGVELLHVSPDALQLGRTYEVRLGLAGDLRATIAALLPEVRALADHDHAAAALAVAARSRAAAIDDEENDALARYGPAPMDPRAAVHALLRAMPDDTVVIDEAISNGAHVRALHRWTEADRMYSGKQIIGWGMGAAIGLCLAHDRKLPILCISGDGSAMFGAQALWTAAHEDVPVVFVVLVNREYAILKQRLNELKGAAHRTGSPVGVDMNDPEIDFGALATSMGLAFSAVEHTDDIAKAVAAVLAAGSPHLLIVPITGADVNR